MRFASACIILFLTARLAFSQEADHKALEGTWNVVSAERDGKTFPEGQNRRFVFSGYFVSSVPKEGDLIEKGTFKLNAAKAPKEIDLWFAVDPFSENPGKKGLMRGIYSVEGMKVKLCFEAIEMGRDAGKGRPTEFSTKQNSDRILLILERAK